MKLGLVPTVLPSQLFCAALQTLEPETLDPLRQVLSLKADKRLSIRDLLQTL